MVLLLATLVANAVCRRAIHRGTERSPKQPPGHPLRAQLRDPWSVSGCYFAPPDLSGAIRKLTNARRELSGSWAALRRHLGSDRTRFASSPHSGASTPSTRAPPFDDCGDPSPRRRLAKALSLCERASLVMMTPKSLP